MCQFTRRGWRAGRTGMTSARKIVAIPPLNNTRRETRRRESAFDDW